MNLFSPYAFFYGVAWGLMTYFAHNTYTNGGISKKIFWPYWVGLVFSSWIGAKLFFIIVNYNYFLKQNFTGNEFLNFFLGGGLVFYGGAISVVIYILVLSRLVSILSLENFSKIVKWIPLSHAIGRLGCFFTGCCYGFTFLGSKNFFLEKFPTQLFESMGLFLIFIFLSLKKTKGIVSLIIYIQLYSVLRFILEFTRGDLDRGMIYSNISYSQLISAILFFVSFFAYKLSEKKLT